MEAALTAKTILLILRCGLVSDETFPPSRALIESSSCSSASSYYICVDILKSLLDDVEAMLILDASTAYTSLVCYDKEEQTISFRFHRDVSEDVSARCSAD
jgi:hypothetical protein